MVMTRWDPFRDFRRWPAFRDRTAHPFQSPGSDEELESWAIPLDVIQEGDNIVVRASVPGVAPQDLEVMVEENILTIKGHTQQEQEHQEGEYLMRERRKGSFHRALRLPETVDTEKAETHYENGVLSVVFPKQEAKKAKHLMVSAGNTVDTAS